MRVAVRRSLAILAVVMMCGAGVAAGAESGAQAGPQKILERRCGQCHRSVEGGGLSRISRERQTPEGWDMTITRMRLYHHVEIKPAEQAALVKYLADNQGLALSEALPYRYILERQPWVIEKRPTGTMELCAACHSFARVGLQRRDAGEWLKLVNFHLGQFPTLEYQSRLRGVQWWKEASTTLPQQLAERFPLESPAWSQWRNHKSPNLAGKWRVIGHEPGRGDYRGLLTVNRKGPDKYELRWVLNYSDGRSAKGAGAAIVYTSYEWRASGKLDGKQIRQVMALTPDGNAMSGRWYYFDTDERGGEMNAARIESGKSRILAVQPSALRIGAPTRLIVVGENLKGSVKLGDGVKVVKVVRHAPDEIVVVAQAESSANEGPRNVEVGSANAGSMLVVYRKLDAIRIEPAYAIARVGDNGGPIPPVVAQFEAIGYTDVSGTKGGSHEVSVGVVPAKWSVAPWDDSAAEMHDVEFAGRMDHNGLFTPAGAGPNPKRKFGTDNTGNLRVKAAVADGAKPLSASAHLIVSVQRWDDPPIR